MKILLLILLIFMISCSAEIETEIEIEKPETELTSEEILQQNPDYLDEALSDLDLIE